MSIVISVSRYAILLAAFAVTLLGGCASRTPAPVIERGAPSARGAAPAAIPARQGEYHTVRKGDTLYSIALEYGQSYRDVAAWNNIDNRNVIRVGQQSRVAAPEGSIHARLPQAAYRIPTR